MRKIITMLTIPLVIFLSIFIFSNYATASSTHVTVHNESDIKILTTLKWANTFPVSSSRVDPGRKAHLNCEYVWYDLYIYDERQFKVLAHQKTVYGNSSWAFTGKKGSYRIEPD